MPILSRCKGAASGAALACHLECISIPFMGIYVIPFVVLLMLLIGMPFTAGAEAKSAIQRLYQQKKAESITSRRRDSAPSIQSRSIVTPLPRAVSTLVPSSVRLARPPPPVKRSQAVEREKSIPSVLITKQLVPQNNRNLTRGLPVSGEKQDATNATTTTPKTPMPVKPNELTIRERQYLDHADRLDREASELWWHQKYLDVENRYREALRYREAVLGRTHPDVAYSLVRLARLYWGSNRTREAAVLHRRALTILEHRLDSESEELANAFWEYGGILQLRGDYATAVSFMAKAIKVLEKDPNSQTNISQRRMTYATVLSELGRSEEAAKILRR